ncbi:stress protein [Alphaproteobacteria bacterium]|nr:stress protein [Alphaproteobacteria bacterium]
MKVVSDNSLESEKKIDIAFCFDDGLWMQAGVAIASLLHSSRGKCSYNIYCIVNKKVGTMHRRELKEIAEKQDSASSIVFIDANHDFDKSHCGEFGIGMYYVLMLPQLLLHLDKIIYSDVDVIFCRDLIEVNDIDLQNNLIAGIKDKLSVSSKKERAYEFDDSERKIGLGAGEYINSGFLIMNLKEFRKQNLYNECIELSKKKFIECPDQDILNYVCCGQKIFIPLKYAFVPWGSIIYNECVRGEIYSIEEYEEALYDPAMIHYAFAKPWKQKVRLEEIWWKYAAFTPFSRFFALDYSRQLCARTIYLFGFIPILSINILRGKIRYYLFGFIPLLKIKREKLNV